MPLDFFEELTRHILYEAKNKDIKSLDLSDDKITVLPDVFEKLTHLEHVNLTNNQISELPPSFYKLVNLKTLSLSKNQFSELPPSFFLFVNLKYLYLSYNRFTEMPYQFNSLHLHELYLTNNPLRSLKNIPFSQIELWEISIDHLPQDYKDYINPHSPFPFSDEDEMCLFDHTDMDDHKRPFINLEEKVRRYHHCDDDYINNL